MQAHEDDASHVANTPTTEVARDPDLWFVDGSVVLEAEETYFKVYSGILSQASPVFKDMFSFPQGGQKIEMYGNCPLVHMLDSAHDLRHFLKALHDSRYVIILC